MNKKRNTKIGLTLAEYVQRRNGVPLGHADSLKNMLYRSFGASSFAKFWQYWNPIWGYGLGKYIHIPLRRFLPAGLALVLTFLVSGAIHDLVVMALRQSFVFLLTPWFFSAWSWRCFGQSDENEFIKIFVVSESCG